MKNTILHFWERYKGYILPLSLVLCVVVLFPHVVHAAPGDPAPASGGNTVTLPSSPDADTMYRDVARFLTFVMQFLQRLIWPVLLLIGGLMKNDILFSAGMEDRMLEIWANVRNIVNILFVLLLLGIAFYNVIGGKNQALHLKEALPKFVIGLIAVNFSFLGVKVIIDTVNVVSTSIFAMPDAVQQGLGDNNINDVDFQKKICEGIYGKDQTSYLLAVNKDPANSLCDPDKKLVDKALAFFARYDSNNAAVVMAINLGKISEYDKVNLTISDIKNLATQTIFSVGLYMVYATAFIALFMVLLVRMIVLWVTIVLSPFMVFAYVLPENLKSSLGGAGEMQKKFVHTAIIPIPIAIMMTIGFMMLRGLQTSKFDTSLTLSTATLGTGFLTSGLSTFQDVIIAVGTIGVIWIGVFEAMKGTYADGIVTKIHDTVQGAGKFALSAIQYAPIFPVAVPKEGGGTEMQNLSLGTGLRIAQQIPQSLENARNTQADEIVQKMMKKNVFEGRKKIREATNAREAMQGVANQGSAFLKDPESIKALGLQLNTNHKDWQRDFDFTGVGAYKTKDGKANYTQATFLAALEKGEVTEDALNAFVQKNKEHMGISAQSHPTKPGEAASGAGAGAPPAIDQTLAEGIAGPSGIGSPYMGSLDKKEKDALDAYNKAKEGKDEKKKTETLVAAQGALGKLKSLIDGGIGPAASQAKTKEELDAMIASRRDALKAAGLSEDAANKAIATEIKTTLADASKAEITSGAEATKIRGAAPKAPVVPPPKPGAGGAKPAGGGGKPAAPKPPATGGSGTSAALAIPIDAQYAAAAGINPANKGAQQGTDGLWYMVK